MKPDKKEEMVIFSVYLPKWMVERLDYLANRDDRARGALIRKLLKEKMVGYDNGR